MVSTEKESTMRGPSSRLARLAAGALVVLVAACSGSRGPTATAPISTAPTGTGAATASSSGTSISTPGPTGSAAAEIDVTTLEGRIVFDDGQDIWSMNADGTGVARLTSEPWREFQAALSPDGGLIAYRAEPNDLPELWIMNADGSGQRQLVPDGGFPAWSPDGSLLAFAPGGGSSGRSWIAVMKPDGSGQRRLDGTDYGENPSWSPDGKQIVFTSAHSGRRVPYVVDVDGSSAVELSNAGEVNGVAWSPDGTSIVFASSRDHSDNYRDIYLMDPDGSNVRRLTNTNAETPAWSPDGHYIVFSAAGGLGVMFADGSGATSIPVPGVGWASFPSWR
jgi:Tol biopolymer transport system component